MKLLKYGIISYSTIEILHFVGGERPKVMP